MKRINMLAVALVAVFAASMGVVAVASAVEFLLALWLDGGAAVTALLPVVNTGELELVSLNAAGLGLVAKTLCSGILDGWVGPESLGHISELLTLAGVAVPTTVLTGTPLLCAEVAGGNCKEPEVWAAALGWDTETELMVDGTETFFVNLILSGGWYAQCLFLGITSSETCSAAETAVKLTNEAGGVVDAEFSDLFQTLATLKLGNCTSGGAESAEVNGLATVSETGTTLTVSSE
jgi:hypothetical protein